MTEAKKEVKPKTGKAPAKAAATPDMFADTGAKKEASKAAKPAASGEAKAKTGTVKLTQIQGTIARKWDQEATLKGLGLGKRHKTSVLKDTPEVRGMIYKVRHLLKVEQA